MKAIYKKSTDIGVGEVSFKACIAKDQGDLRRTAIWAKRALNGVHAKFVVDKSLSAIAKTPYMTPTVRLAVKDLVDKFQESDTILESIFTPTSEARITEETLDLLDAASEKESKRVAKDPWYDLTEPAWEGSLIKVCDFVPSVLPLPPSPLSDQDRLWQSARNETELFKLTELASKDLQQLTHVLRQAITIDELLAACSLSYVVARLDEYFTSKKCPRCRLFVAQSDLRRFYCQCHVYYYRDVMVKENMANIVQGHLLKQERVD
ncbi:hypothetical protein BGZ98_000477 [Dissophora globulifera]|nr:hypothetical protein BGZ98_000477 [Dissophora globulifera]